MNEAKHTHSKPPRLRFEGESVEDYRIAMGWDDAAEKHTPNPWRPYKSERPTEERAYQWRLPSISLPGAFVIFTAHMRMRGNGYNDPILSPSFDYWDGYSVSVPDGTEWREADPVVKCAPHETAGLAIEDLDFAPCLYCERRPNLRGYQYARYGGIVCGANPQHLNSWSLTCCDWGKTPSLSDPREIELIRRAARVKAATTHIAVLLGALQAVEQDAVGIPGLPGENGISDATRELVIAAIRRATTPAA